MEDLTGRVIKAYELRERIGQGGFGEVYRAHQQLIGREVAIKIILPHYANRPEFIRRFETEAQLVAKLEHPYIVPLYDYWREPSGAYLVMRWLRGGNIQHKLSEIEVFDLRSAGRILNQVAEALIVAHRQGVIHRDIKPENLLLDESGNAYLSDFGIAKEMGSQQNLTQNNAILGSPAYLSPEQIRGEGVSPQSDIYSLGIVLYEMLTGKRPFDEPTPAALMYKHLSEPLPDPLEIRSDLPPAVHVVLQRAAAKEPADRYADTIDFAREFRMAIKSMLSAEDIAESSLGTAIFTSPTKSDIHVPEPENPYKGLRAFQQVDSDDFFGRETLTMNILQRLQEPVDNARFLAVVGPSGSGKSSVVKAGLIPELRRGALAGSDRWFMVEMLPGIDPMEELEAALLRIAVNPPESLLDQLNSDERGLLRAIKRVLPDDDTELLIFIDQFEEIFTLVDDEPTRRHFMNSVSVAVSDPRSRVRVVMTLRADFYDRPLQYAGFGELMRSRTEVVLPMNAEELERAISGPARRAGLHLEDGLVTSIVADVNEQPGALPLLQYALTELFERRNGAILLQAAYADIGGTMGALARRADELYEGLSDEGQEAARQMFLRLVTLGEGTEDTRRRAFQSELLSIGDDPDEMSMVIDAFGRYRLLTFDRDPITRTATVEVAHEALIRQWSRLRGWLNESRDDLRTQRRVSALADEWLNSGRDVSYLARGGRLQQFETWYAASKLSLNDVERQYLEASIEERRKRDDEERARQQREAELEQRSRNRLRALVTVMSVAAVVAFALALFAFSQQQVAQSSQADAERSAAQAESLALAANSRNTQIQHNTTLALSLALAAVDLYDPPSLEVLRVLATSAYSPGVRARFDEYESTVLSGDISADGRFTVSASADGLVRIWDNDERVLVQIFDAPDEILTTVKFSPDDRFLLMGGTSGDLVLYEIGSGEIVRTFSGHTDTVTSVFFSTDGSQALSGSVDRTMRLWDVETGETIRVFDADTGVVFKVALTPDNRFAVSAHGDERMLANDLGERDRMVRVWDVEAGEVRHEFALDGGWVRTVAVSPDGRLVASGTWSGAFGGTIRIWDIESGDETLRVFGHLDLITGLVFSSDSERLFSVSWDRTLRAWDVARGIELARFDVFDDLPLDIALSDDSEYAAVFTGNLGGNQIEPDQERAIAPAIMLIDLAQRAQARLFTGSADWVWDVTVHPEGRYAISTSGPFQPLESQDNDNLIRVWDLTSGELVEAIGADYDDDGNRLYPVHSSTVESVNFNVDGTRFVTAGWDGQAILWSFDAETGRAEEIRRFVLPDDGIRAINAQISPDNAFVAVSDGAGTVTLWDAQAGELIRQFGDHTNVVAGIAFSPDGNRLVTGSYDTRATIWDVATGERLVDLNGHTDRVNDVVFTPDGSKVLTASWDVTARIWDAATGQQIRQFTGHADRLQAVTVNADGTLALSGGADTTMRLWSIDTGQEIFVFEGHQNWVSQVAFLSDDRMAISSGQDNVLRLWRMPLAPDEIIAWSFENRYVRDLTCSEREQFRVSPLCDS